MVDREYDINNMVRRVKTSLGDTLATYLYFADGEKHGVTTAPRYLYNGKEKQEFIHNTGSVLNAAGSATYTSNYIDYGARFYNPVTLCWTTQNPMAEKYMGYSPYNYCVNNPINFVDPNGMIWEDPKDAENLKTQIDKRINQLNKNNNKLQAKIAKGGLSDKKLAKIQDRIAENEVKILFLNKSLVDIKNIEEAKEVFRLAGPSQSDGTHGVVRGCDGVINIEGSNNGLYLHEMRHVGQSTEVGELKFNEKGQLYNSGKTKENRIENEVEAYKVQYSYDGSYPIGAISLKDINAETLMNIKKKMGHQYMNN